jgi:glycosyltransferase involved in cell wall biosynthesis
MLLSNCFDPDPRVHQEAKALRDDGYDITVIGWDRDLKKPAHEEIDGIKVERIYVRSSHGRGTGQVLFLAFFWIKAFWRIFRTDFDVIHCHDFDTLPPGFALGRLRGKSVVYDSHESYTDMLRGSINPYLAGAITFVETVLIRRIDLLITVGEILKREFENRGAKNVCVVGNWKSPKQFAFDDAVISSVRRRLGIPERAIVIVYIAWLSAERQIEALLEAAASLTDLYLLIGGEGPLRKLVQERVKRTRNIIYLGFVDPKDVPLYTAVADIVFYGFDKNNPNSKYSAPNKLFEALAAGKALVTGDFGEIGKVVAEEQCGISLPDLSADTLKTALLKCSDPERLRRFKENAGRAGAARFNWCSAETILRGKYAALLNTEGAEAIAGV